MRTAHLITCSMGKRSGRMRTGAVMALAILLSYGGLAADASAASRPFSDFLSTQGTTNVFFPPTPDYIGWCGAAARPPARFALIDYAGLAATWLQQNGGPSLGTQVSGTVNEKILKDGRAEVTVNLTASRALTWATDCVGDLSGPLLFGYRAADLAANPALTPGLATLSMHVVFNNTAPGASLPDLVNAFILGNAAPGQELLTLSFRADAAGPLRSNFGVPEGTPGKVIVSQTGNISIGPRGANSDGFPAEKVEIKVAP
jgi:hypothetical protein